MKPQSQIYVLIIIMAMVLSNACSDSERRIGLSSQTATVVINLNLPDKHASLKASVLDRIFSFFVKDAVAQTAPPVPISSITVRVTGPDISTIEKNFISSGTISLEVPAGSLRVFDVTAYVDPSDPSAAVSFRGTDVANLPAGTTVNVPVVMNLNETKLVIPDQWNHRLVALTSLSSASWNTVTSIPGVTQFDPMDIDYDNRGRIYIANNSSPGVIRIDDLNGLNVIMTTNFLFGSIQNVNSIAVDRTNNYVYFTTTSALYRSNFDGTATSSALALPSIISGMNIRGIDVDSSGMLYIVATPVSVGPSYIVKYNPNNESQIGTEYSANLSNPWDVLIRGSDIYVANYSGSSGYQLLQLNWSSNIFTLVNHGGTIDATAVTDKTTPGRFYGARRFIGIRNDGFYIIDNLDANARGNMSSLQKMAFMTDINGANWIGFGDHGNSTDQFLFYSSC